MLFIQKLCATKPSTSTPSAREKPIQGENSTSQNANTSQTETVPSKKSIPTDQKIKTDSSIEPSPNTSKPKKVGLLRSAVNSTINISKAMLTLGIISFVAIFKIPGIQKTTNEIYREFGTQPKPYAAKVQERYLGGVALDRFVGNYKGIEKIEGVVKKENLNIEKINSDNNGWVLDKPIEIKELINELKSIDEKQYDEEIKLLEEINLTSQLIWGRNGPTVYKTRQGNREDCQVMGAVQAQWATEENIQNIKGNVRITQFNSSKDNLRIDTVVELNNEIISIPFETLVQWMSPQGSIQSYSTDKSLAVPILTYALEHELLKYGGIPNSYTSAPATIISGKDCSSIFVQSLSDTELINILSKAPNTPTYISTYGYLNKKSDNPITNLIYDYKNLFNFVEPDGSGQTNFNAKFFVRELQTYLEEIQNDKTTIPLRKSAHKSKVEELTSYHVYTVKDFKNINGQYITTLIDSSGFEFDLTLDEVKKVSRKITSESKNFPDFGSESAKSTLIALALIIAILAGAHKLNIKLDPRYKSSLIKLGKKLTSLLRNSTPISN